MRTQKMKASQNIDNEYIKSIVMVLDYSFLFFLEGGLLSFGYGLKPKLSQFNTLTQI